MYTYFLSLPFPEPWNTLHATLCPYFDSFLEADELVPILTPVFADQDPLLVRSIQPDLFGPCEDVPVDRIKGRFLHALHVKAHRALNRTRGFKIRQPDWWHDGYKPHVSESATHRQRFATGDIATLDAVTLMQPNVSGDAPRTRHRWSLRIPD